jgi:hypothetical protein
MLCWTYEPRLPGVREQDGSRDDGQSVTFVCDHLGLRRDDARVKKRHVFFGVAALIKFTKVSV